MIDEEAARLIEVAWKYRAAGDDDEYARTLRKAAEWCWNRGNRHEANTASWCEAHTTGREARDWHETVNSFPEFRVDPS